MDLLAEVTRQAELLEVAKAKYEEAREARNAAIRAARADRYGPGLIGAAADMTPEQVRRICKTKAQETTYGWSEKGGIRKKQQ